jgi:hypothetical protein
VTDTFTVGAVELIADTSQAFRIGYDPNAFSDDKVTVETSPAGLITAVNTTVESKAVDFTKKFQEFVNAATPTVIKSFVADQPAAPTPFSIRVRIDPASSDDVKRIEAALGKLAPDLTFKSDRVNSAYDASLKPSGRPSLWVALPAIYRLSLSRTAEIIGETLVTIPEQGKAIGIDVSRAAFTKAETKLTSTSGYLTKYDYSKGSEAVGAASIPVEAAKAIVS